VAIITGGGGGFGQITAQKIAAMGGKVVLADIDEKGLIRTADTIKNKGGQAEYIVADVANKEQMDAMAQFALNKYGAVDVLVNNAGVMPIAYYRDHEAAWKAWDRCIDINLKGTVHGIIAVYDIMMKQGRGQVINISSVYGNYPVAGAAVYSATKVGIRYLSESLRMESQGAIKVTVVNPTGTLGTNLGAGIINFSASQTCILGHKQQAFMDSVSAMMAGELSEDLMDKNNPRYFNLDADSLTDSIVYCMNQPWGVSISNITVRSTGEAYLL
jgi:NADP-dependent 3-hydroxy acid dehydrogenase YdfG